MSNWYCFNPETIEFTMFLVTFHFVVLDALNSINPRYFIQMHRCTDYTRIFTEFVFTIIIF